MRSMASFSKSFISSFQVAYSASFSYECESFYVYQEDMEVLNDRSLPVRSGAPSSSPPLPTLVEEIGSRECCWRGRHIN